MTSRAQAEVLLYLPVLAKGYLHRQPRNTAKTGVVVARILMPATEAEVGVSICVLEEMDDNGGVLDFKRSD